MTRADDWQALGRRVVMTLQDGRQRNGLTTRQHVRITYASTAHAHADVPRSRPHHLIAATCYAGGYRRLKGQGIKASRHQGIICQRLMSRRADHHTDLLCFCASVPFTFGLLGSFPLPLRTLPAAAAPHLMALGTPLRVSLRYGRSLQQ